MPDAAVKFAPVLLVAAAAVIYARRQLSASDGSSTADSGDAGQAAPVDGASQQTTILEDFSVAIDPTSYMPVPDTLTTDQADANLRAFLDMIAYSEGTSGPDGYRAMFGYPAPDRLMVSFADHPRKRFPFTDKTGKTSTTSAAGRYQFLISTWDELRAKLGLQDFSPESQDRAAIELIRQRGALNDVKAGRLTDAIRKCNPIWASLPGAGYNQPERKLAQLQTAFLNAGGNQTA